MAIEQILSLLQQTSGKSSRATALQPLIWLMLVLAIFFSIALGSHAAAWISIVLLVFIAVVLTVTLVAYLYFMKHDSDALRSEKFTLDKLALRQSRTGDDRAGFAERPYLGSASLDQVSLGAPTNDEDGEE